MALVNNPIDIIVDKDISINSSIEKFTLVDLSYYARKHIDWYSAIKKIPQSHMDYINNVKYAVNCDSMFSGCESLVKLDLSNFDTSKVTNMNYMFWDCSSLTTIKGVLDLSSCKEAGEMFGFAVSSLRGLHLKNVPRSVLSGNGLLGAEKWLNTVYFIDNILEDR